jgi:CO/xanthine dehydrogenase Mo-binding subunit
MSTETASKAVGARLRRLEDDRLLRGLGSYVADVELPGMLSLAVVRSELAHARVRGVDVTAARGAPGVVDAFAAADIPEFLKPLPSRSKVAPEHESVVQRPFGVDRVRYVGEPLAVVIATSRYLAEDAADLVKVDLEPLPAVVEAAAAIQPDAQRLFDAVENNFKTLEVGSDAVEAAIEGAEHVIERTFRTHRHSGVPLECRGLVAMPEGDNGLALYGVTKLPHYHRAAVARALDMDPGDIRVVRTDIGGGFGVRGEFYPEDVLVPLAALRTKRPVQWVEDRREHLLAANHSRQHEWRLTAAFDRDGRLSALDAELISDMGAYLRPIGTDVAFFASLALPGPYRIPAYRCRVQGVLTNKMGVGTVRSPGCYEATFARERLLDICAGELGIDRLELRRRNLVAAGDMPYDTGIPAGPANVLYDGGDYPLALDEVLSALGEEPPPQADPGRAIGIGVACTNEATGWGPAEVATATRTADGDIVIRTGSAGMGQGHRTALAQVAADALELAPEQIEIVDAEVDAADIGSGTFASRTAMMAGNAVWLAASELRERLTTAAPGEPITVTRTFDFQAETFSYASSAAVVELDLELGVVRVLRYVVAADVGTVINPMLVEGQLAGAAAQGIGGALLEELPYSDEGQPLATTFMDYLLPSSLDVPAVEVILLPPSPTEANPLGIRGAGEIGTAGSGAAIANAVADALGQAGQHLCQLPLKPDRVLELSQAVSRPA